MWLVWNQLEMINKISFRKYLAYKSKTFEMERQNFSKNTCLVNQTISILLVLLNLCFFNQILEDILGNHWWFNKSQNFVQI